MKDYVSFGAKKRNTSWNETVVEAVLLEKDIIRTIISIMNIKENASDVLGQLAKRLERLVKDYCYIMCHKRSMTYYERENSLKRLLLFLLVYPVKNNISLTKTEFLFSKIPLINMVTYGYFQVCEKPIRSKVLSRYIKYLDKSKWQKLAIIFLYRVNPSYIKKEYSLGEMQTLTKKELYYGISTGFFETRGKGKDAILRLMELSANSELELLRKAGFYLAV